MVRREVLVKLGFDQDLDVVTGELRPLRYAEIGAAYGCAGRERQRAESPLRKAPTSRKTRIEHDGERYTIQAKVAGNETGVWTGELNGARNESDIGVLLSAEDSGYFPVESMLPLRVDDACADRRSRHRDFHSGCVEMSSIQSKRRLFCIQSPCEH